MSETAKLQNIIYEPIDSRTLSKKEKVYYLVTCVGKPRLDRRASLALSDDSDSDFDEELPSPKVSSEKPHSEIQPQQRAAAPRKSIMPETPRERLEAELRKMDDFWSFKPIPREPSFLGHSPSRATFPTSPVRSSSPSSSSYSSSPESSQSPRSSRGWWI